MNNNTKKINHKNKPSHNTAQQLIDNSMNTSEDANKLSTIRDILFGQQAREDEEKRHSLHKEFKSHFGQLQQETQSQFKQISGELDKLYQLIKSETEHRVADGKNASQQAAKLQQSLESSNKNIQKAQQKLKQEFTQANDDLSKQSKQLHEELSNKLDQASKELRSEATDRGDLAKMLRGMAEQLAEEQK